MTIKEAFKELQPDYTDASEAFLALYSVLGRNELYDAIYTEMCDLGFEDFIEELIYLIDEKDEK